MLFSIITVSYNAEETIQSTVKSVLEQSFDNFEIIIKDGQSKDETVQNIPKNSKVKVFVERDSGIYDAMNQAVEKASGEYLIFMNCGDAFADNMVLQTLSDEIQRNNKPDILYGDYYIGGCRFVQPSQITDFYLYRTPLCHQSMIIRKSVFDEMLGYDTKYKILADYDFTQKCWHNKKRFVHSDLTVCSYLGGGVSEQPEGIKKKENERRTILGIYYSKGQRFLFDTVLVLSLRKIRIWISSNGPVWLKKGYRSIVNLINQ